MLRWPDKDPNDNLAYEVDLSDAISTDTVSSVAWAVANVPGGSTALVLTPVTHDAGLCIVDVSGGTAGHDYVVRCRATLASSAVLDQSVLLKVRER